MPLLVNVHTNQVHGTDHLAVAAASVQSAIGLPVNKQLDRQAVAGRIIDMQNKLVQMGKLSASRVCKSIDDQHLSQKLIEVEAAANT